MKKLFGLGVLIVFCFLRYGLSAPPVMEVPIKSYGTPTTVAISSTTLTQIPSSQTTGRIGIFFDNPNTNSGRMSGFLGNCTSTALASTIRPIEISPGNNSSYFPLRDDVCLWLIDLSTVTSTENSHYQEVTQ